MRRSSFPAMILLAVTVVFAAGCGSDEPASDATAKFDPPPLSPTPAPADTPVTTATASATDRITVDNAGMLEEVAAAQLGEPFSRLTWRADGGAVFVTTRQEVFGMTKLENALTPLLSVEEPAYVLDVSSLGVAAVAEDQHTISLRETGPDTVVKTLQLPETLTSAVFSPDGKVLAVTIAESIATQIWDVDSGAKVSDVAGFETAAPAYSVEFGPDGRSIVWVSRSLAQVQDLVTSQFGPVATEDDFISGVKLSPGEPVLATGAGPKLTLWDLDSGDILDVFDLPDAVTALAYSPDGRLIFVSTGLGVTILHLPLLTPAGGLPGAMQSMVVAPDGDAIAVVGADGRVAILAP